MAQAAMIHNKIPRKMSFKLALQMICSFRQNGMLCDSNEYYLYLLKSIAYKDVNNRPGRSEPRRVKRRKIFGEVRFLIPHPLQSSWQKCYKHNKYG
jgi:hypothetical protein